MQCVHCYADSGPDRSHGRMAGHDWRRVIDEAAELGVGLVQFIGGEPTMHPQLLELINHARSAGVEVEVFSNLVRVTPAMWSTFEQPGVRLACSYYSDDPAEHVALTGRSGSHARTRANILEAVRRSIPLRVGVVDLGGGQSAARAVAEMTALGVADVGYDRLREVGRGIRGGSAGVEQLCRRCASGVLAVSSTGDVWPCVFSRWLVIGNALRSSLADIVASQRCHDVRRQLREQFDSVGAPCVPNLCNPQCGPSCSPACRPANNCRPVGAYAPWYR